MESPEVVLDSHSPAVDRSSVGRRSVDHNSVDHSDWGPSNLVGRKRRTVKELHLDQSAEKSIPEWLVIHCECIKRRCNY